MYMWLTENIKSGKGTLYGRKGERVSLVDDTRGDVLIVSKENGERFPVRRELLSDKKIKQEAAPAAADQNQISKSGRVANKKGAPGNENTLF